MVLRASTPKRKAAYLHKSYLHVCLRGYLPTRQPTTPVEPSPTLPAQFTPPRLS